MINIIFIIAILLSEYDYYNSSGESFTVVLADGLLLET